MSFFEMKGRLQGEIPGIGIDLSGSLINEALGKILDDSMWSFQCQESGWLTPGLLFASNLLSAGSITTTAYSNQVVGDAAAAAAWVAYASMPLLTQFQIRLPACSLYNIIAFDGVNTLTIDRPWMETAGAAQVYMMYQAYFAAPVADFKRFLSIKDTTNGGILDFWTYSRKDLDLMDPQRTAFEQPGYAVPFGQDARVGSATLGYMLFELWPHPLSVLPYTFSYLRRGNLLSLPADILQSPLTEELVLWRAKECACLWKEANKGEGQRRDMGTDWKFLAAAHHKEYLDCLKSVRGRDRDLMELYFNRFVRDASIQAGGEPFATRTGGLNVGRF